MNDASIWPAPTNGAGLRCPKCGHTRFRVLYTRPRTDGKLVRRRECLACGARITTAERILGGREPPRRSPVSDIRT